MADVVSVAMRSRMMAGIRGKNTKPEMIIRRGLHASGFRYLLHDKRLPGKPDLVFPKHRAVIFVHGCFWHGHDCHLFKWPKTRKVFWRKKIERNRWLDKQAISELQKLGWRIGIVWECSIKGRTKLAEGRAVALCAKWLCLRKRNFVLLGKANERTS
jgi:DNA mismatch endonuclease (patch repair protein)